MTDRNQIGRLTKLGIGDFELADEVKRRQDDLVERLKANMWFRNRSNTLAHCTTNHCSSQNESRFARCLIGGAGYRTFLQPTAAKKGHWNHS